MSEHINDQPLSEQVDRLRQAQIEHAATHTTTGQDTDSRLAQIEQRLDAIEKRLDYHDTTASQTPRATPTHVAGENPYQGSADVKPAENKTYFTPDEPTQAE